MNERNGEGGKERIGERRRRLEIDFEEEREKYGERERARVTDFEEVRKE